MLPKVSVIMPMYNSKAYVKEAIDSLLHQTYTDIEIIAINDGSKDGCADIVSKIKDDRLRFIDSEENHGFLYTLNWCIELAKGEYIARLDDDDVAFPTRLEKQVVYMDSHPEIVISGTGADLIVNGEIVEAGDHPTKNSKQMKFALPFANYTFPHSSFIMRKSIIDKYKIRYEKYIQCPDYHMIMVMSQYGEIGRIDEHLIGYRIHSTQSTAVRTQKMKIGEDDANRVEYIDSLNLPNDVKQGLKIGVLRKIKNTRDFDLFIDSFEAYRDIMNMADDNECVEKVLGSVLKSQKHIWSYLPVLLKKYNGKRIYTITGRRSIYNCLINNNEDYIESEIYL